MSLLLPEEEYQMKLFQWYLPTVQTWCPNLKFLRDWKYIDFQTDYFADFEKFKVDIYFANTGKIKIDLICSLLQLWTGRSYFTSLGKLCCEKQSKPSPFDKNSRNTHRI